MAISARTRTLRTHDRRGTFEAVTDESPKPRVLIATGEREREPDPFAEPPRRPLRRTGIETTALDPRELQGEASWHLAIASLERIDPRLVYALRLGVLEFGAELIAAMRLPDAKRDLADRLREVGEWLQRIPFDR